ncbi:hypothetical protein JTE90_000979 [Oedothorax gibbosus]|uniref:Uncharacterized protein n=1 Tax=Oedothorax gibbosus TaxID=931172 RepID=A0AAV6VET1_9ARAC|nr:hypothetical protein JTE90_000979 [Oedothorax gibbosus]
MERAAINKSAKPRMVTYPSSCSRPNDALCVAAGPSWPLHPCPWHTNAHSHLSFKMRDSPVIFHVLVKVTVLRDEPDSATPATEESSRDLGGPIQEERSEDGVEIPIRFGAAKRKLLRIPT